MELEISFKSFSKVLNNFTKDILNNIYKDNLIYTIKKNNNIVKLLQKKHNYVMKEINNIGYIDEKNYLTNELFLQAKKQQEKLLNIIKTALESEEKQEYILEEIFFSMQKLHFSYTCNNKKVSSFGSNTKYKYILEEIIFKNISLHPYIKNIYNKILEDNLNKKHTVFIFSNNKYNLTEFSKKHLDDNLIKIIFESDIKDITLKQELQENLLNITNRLKLINLHNFLLINLILKYNIINFKDYEKLLIFLKTEIDNLLTMDLKCLIIKETLNLWIYNFIINYLLFLNSKSIIKKKYIQILEKDLFNKDYINKLYTIYPYMKYI